MSTTVEPPVPVTDADACGPGGGRRRLLGFSGLLLVLAGLAVLAWAGWQLYGTNWVSHRQQDAVVEQLRKQWTQRDQNAEDPQGARRGLRQVRTDHGTAGAIIHIPRFGSDYAVPVLEGTGDDQLASGFGHYDGTAGPGQQGNYAVAAHRITHGEPLRRMPELQVGDEVDVEVAGTTYVYRLTTDGTSLVVPFTQTWVIARLPRNPDPGGVEPRQASGRRLLTLTTCSELFHTDNRAVSFAILVETRDS